MTLVFDGPKTGPLFVFAHGAGAPLSSAFMELVSKGLAEQGIRVARFNFHYMQQRIECGHRRPPERAPQLVKQFGELIQQIDQPMVIGGKSMGGRIATLLAAEKALPFISYIKGIACLGYPFHPQGKPEQLRVEHLSDIDLPLAIIQGARDKLGCNEEVRGYALPETIQWCWLEDGDHDFKPRIKSGFTHEQHINTCIRYLASYIKTCHQVN